MNWTQELHFFLKAQIYHQLFYALLQYQGLEDLEIIHLQRLFSRLTSDGNIAELAYQHKAVELRWQSSMLKHLHDGHISILDANIHFWIKVDSDTPGTRG